MGWSFTVRSFSVHVGYACYEILLVCREDHKQVFVVSKIRRFFKLEKKKPYQDQNLRQQVERMRW